MSRNLSVRTQKQPKVELPIPANFSWRECMFFLDRGYDEVLYQVGDAQVVRACEIGGQPCLLQFRKQDDRMIIDQLLGTYAKGAEQEIAHYATRWFDLDSDIQPFYDLLHESSVLSYFPDKFSGLRLLGIPDLHEAICWCIIGQQINLTFAYKMKRRLTEKYGQSISFGGNKYYLFPKPDVLAKCTIDELKNLQFSRQKAQYVIGVSQSFCDGDISLDILQHLPDFESRKKRLIELKGIGAWTANYVLMKTLRDPDCIPYGDTGLVAALKKHNIIGDKSERERIEAFFDEYVGWKSYLSFYLWRSLYHQE